jgi:hypothetical protein
LSQKWDVNRLPYLPHAPDQAKKLQAVPPQCAEKNFELQNSRDIFLAAKQQLFFAAF